jgi:hypothetical protein
LPSTDATRRSPLSFTTFSKDTYVTLDELHAYGLPDAVISAVVALTRQDGVAYEDYIEQVALNPIARQVKAADIEDNLTNNRRLPATPDVTARIVRYERALIRLRL